MKKNSKKRKEPQNRKSTIKRIGHGNRTAVTTAGRDPGTLRATAFVRRRCDTKTTESLAGMTIKLPNSNVDIKLNGYEARTIYRVLRRAARGRKTVMGYSD